MDEHELQHLTDDQLFFLGLQAFVGGHAALRARVLAEQERRGMIGKDDGAPRLASPPTYGQSLRWTRGLGESTTYEVSGCPTPEAAWEKVMVWAHQNGWTPPRWWQVWRRHDTRIPTWYSAGQ